VISLTGSLERQERFRREASEATVAWEFFEAHKSIAAPLTYDKRQAVRRFGRPLTAGEIGCYVSHFKVWESFLESGYEQAVVLEDDVIVDWPMIEYLLGYNLSKAGIDLLRLYCMFKFESRLQTLWFATPQKALLRASGLFLGTQAYLITRRAAVALLSVSSSIVRPIDWQMTRFWDYKLPHYCLFPYPIIERYSASTIEHANLPVYETGMRDKAARIGYWLHDQLSRRFEDFKQNRVPFQRKVKHDGQDYLSQAGNFTFDQVSGFDRVPQSVGTANQPHVRSAVSSGRG
jgi:glycosyl transferase family 25